MRRFKSVFAVLSVTVCLTAHASLRDYCPLRLLELFGLAPKPPAARVEPAIDWSAYIPPWYPQHMECQSADGSLTRTPITGEPVKRYLPAGRRGQIDPNVFFEQKQESGRQWLWNGSELAGVRESFSLPTKKDIHQSFRYVGSAISTWCEEVTVEMTVTLSDANGQTLHQMPVSCKDLGCFGAGHR